MNSFTPDWLALREPADRRARNRELQDALAARFALRNDVSVLDLASGTGANLRAIAGLLPARQRWVLVDNDETLIEASRMSLRAWADSVQETPGGLLLTCEKRSIEVEFRKADLANDTKSLIEGGYQLVTASALFDLVSQDFMRALVAAVSANRAVLYAVLTFNGLQRWTPHRPGDNQMASAFNRHQMRDKGFGPAAGPVASAYLADQLRLNGYSVLEGRSDWQLNTNDRMLVDELVHGHAHAVAETRLVAESEIIKWLGVRRVAATVGHEDLLAIPP